MPVTVVVGGQYGGEGKGKVTAHLCANHGYHAVVRCGGPNSGHTVSIDGQETVLRQVPAGVVNPETQLFLAAGCLINVALLFEEIDRFGLTPDRLKVDSNAMIITEEEIQSEKTIGLEKSIGSTCSGVGAAVARRVSRNNNVKLARDIPELEPFLSLVSIDLNLLHDQGKKMIVEGTQGFGLSLYHTRCYPFATSRDTTASAFLSEAGLSPLTVAGIIMVLRTYPIRVGGNSGPLSKETDWETVRSESRYPYSIEEHTSVTKRLRRVGRFDLDLARQAAEVNRPTAVALMGLDYLDYENKSATTFSELTEDSRDFVSEIQHAMGTRVAFLGTGPKNHEILDLTQGISVEEGTCAGEIQAAQYY